MSWIEVIFNFLRDQFPLKFVPPWAKGIRVRFGSHIKLFEPGPAWIWWVIDNWIVVNVVPEVINLPTQSLTTKDSQTISFSANIEYEVVDAVSKYTKVADFDSSMVNGAMGYVAKKIRDWTYQELVEGQRKLELSIRDSLTTYVKNWGVRINDVRITDLVRARQYRLFGDPPAEIKA